MAKEIKTCRVCGEQYEACRTSKVNNSFRWQDVSCSPGCGAEYLRRIRVSREQNNQNNVVTFNEEYNGFWGKPDEEYINGFGFDEE